MPEVGFDPTITASERAKIVHASNRSATVTGDDNINVDFSEIDYEGGR
jgi:hypothetical protein